MNVYQVTLFSKIRNNYGHVSITFKCRSDMNHKQLQTYYKCIGSVSVSDVNVTLVPVPKAAHNP